MDKKDYKTTTSKMSSIQVIYEMAGYMPPPIPDDCLRVFLTLKYKGWKAKREDVEAWMARTFGLPSKPQNTFRNPVMEGPHLYYPSAPASGTSMERLEREVQYLPTPDAPVSCRIEFVGQTFSRVSVERIPYKVEHACLAVLLL